MRPTAGKQEVVEQRPGLSRQRAEASDTYAHPTTAGSGALYPGEGSDE